jgi:DNA modification methylase
MQTNTFFIQELRNKFLNQNLSEFNAVIPQDKLNIENRKRANIFSWRGQFSPQLIENLLLSYCPKTAVILDPFVGSGTSLYEAACLGLPVFGCEVNPAAWILSRTYQIINLKLETRNNLLNSITNKLETCFPKPKLFQPDKNSELTIFQFKSHLDYLYKRASLWEIIILNTFVILLDLGSKKLDIEHIYHTFHKLSQVITNLPYSPAPITSLLCDARCLSVDSESIDLVITSPPYINVFNYHQNYRLSAEILGWDLLKIAKSEIGSNRANRKNRFFTVVQYCLDMAFALREIQRVCKPNARIIFVVGYESKVLGVPFYNSQIISALATQSNMFKLNITQNRSFKNKFGKVIREDILNISKTNTTLSIKNVDEIARKIAYKVLHDGLAIVGEHNKSDLVEAIDQIHDLSISPLYVPETKIYY